MKKTLLSLSLVSVLALAANAQDAAAGSEFKPSAGNVTVEVDAYSPFSGGGASPFNLNNNSLRVRYFISDGLAFRTNFVIGVDNQKQDFGGKSEANTTGGGQSTSGSSVSNKVIVKSNSFTFSIMPGIEVHKAVSERLSAYYGAVLDLTINSKRGSVEATAGSSTGSGTTTNNFDGSYKYELKGANFDDISENPFGATGITLPSRNSEGGFTRIGLMGVLGADYYITKALYLGTEVAWGFGTTSYAKVTSTETDSVVPTGSPASTTTIKTEENKDSALNFAPMVNANFRLGFWF